MSSVMFHLGISVIEEIYSFIDRTSLFKRRALNWEWLINAKYFVYFDLRKETWASCNKVEIFLRVLKDHKENKSD